MLDFVGESFGCRRRNDGFGENGGRDGSLGGENRQKKSRKFDFLDFYLSYVTTTTILLSTSIE